MLILEDIITRSAVSKKPEPCEQLFTFFGNTNPLLAQIHNQQLQNQNSNQSQDDDKNSHDILPGRMNVIESVFRQFIARHPCCPHFLNQPAGDFDQITVQYSDNAGLSFGSTLDEIPSKLAEILRVNSIDLKTLAISNPLTSSDNLELHFYDAFLQMFCPSWNLFHPRDKLSLIPQIKQAVCSDFVSNGLISRYQKKLPQHIQRFSMNDLEQIYSDKRQDISSADLILLQSVFKINLILFNHDDSIFVATPTSDEYTPFAIMSKSNHRYLSISRSKVDPLWFKSRPIQTSVVGDLLKVCKSHTSFKFDKNIVRLSLQKLLEIADLVGLDTLTDKGKRKKKSDLIQTIVQHSFTDVELARVDDSITL